MDIINSCFDFYVENLRPFDKDESLLSHILSAALNGEDVEDELASYACDAERHGFENGFRFAIAVQFLGKEINLTEHLENILPTLNVIGDRS